MMVQNTAVPQHARERAYLYDLYIAPNWREIFDQLVDEEVKLPEEGKLLDAGCGTGGYAVELAVRMGAKGLVVGVDEDAERLTLARAKAEVKKLDQLSFRQGAMTALGLSEADFDWVVGDLSLRPVSETAAALKELGRVARYDAPLTAKLATRGSFDEFFSLYWEALYELDLTAYTPQLEKLITERLTLSEAEDLARAAGWREVRGVTSKELLNFSDAAAFLDAPLIATEFLAHWLAPLPDEATRRNVRQQLAQILERERQQMDFEVSLKATLIMGRK